MNGCVLTATFQKRILRHVIWQAYRMVNILSALYPTSVNVSADYVCQEHIVSFVCLGRSRSSVATRCIHILEIDCFPLESHKTSSVIRESQLLLQRWIRQAMLIMIVHQYHNHNRTVCPTIYVCSSGMAFVIVTRVSFARWVTTHREEGKWWHSVRAWWKLFFSFLSSFSSSFLFFNLTFSLLSELFYSGTHVIATASKTGPWGSWSMFLLRPKPEPSFCFHLPLHRSMIFS